MADEKMSCEDKIMIGGSRVCGKTTELIKKASEEQLYIICSNRHKVSIVSNMAREMNLDIPFPISLEELPLRGYMKDVLVDDVEEVLSKLIGKRVVGASTSFKLKAMKEFKNVYGNNEIRISGGVDYASGKDKSIGTIKVNLDCREALIGLKAIQREAKKATASLRELEDQEKRMSSDYVTLKSDDGMIIHKSKDGEQL